MVIHRTQIQFGISIVEPKKQPDYYIHRFRIFTEGRNYLLEQNRQSRNVNFQVCGHPNEIIAIRMYMSEEKFINDVRCYLLKDFDAEMAKYITQALVQRIGLEYRIATDLKFKYIALWSREK